MRRTSVLVAVGLVAHRSCSASSAAPPRWTRTAYPSTTIAVIQGNVPEPGLEFNARRRAVTDLHAAETARLAAAVRAGTAPKADSW